DLLEVAETVEVALGAVDEHAIVRIAFADFELAADHIFAGLVVAVNIDPLDIDARPLVDDEIDRDGPIGLIALTARASLREGVSFARDFARQYVDRLFHGVAVIDVARRQPHQRPQCGRVDVRQMRLNVDRGDGVLRPLLDPYFEDIANLGGL